MTTYNGDVDTANVIITAKKKETGEADVQAVEAELAHLTAQKARHTNAVSDQCVTYVGRLTEKVDFEAQKEETRKQLDEHTEALITHYGQSITRNLDRFHADFKISSPKHSYRGGTASSSYQILINEVAVDLGDPKTPLDQPSFKNTLSSGDRNTLALAFFFAELERDPAIADKIVVLDDPFNSQDAFRQNQTVQQIKRMAESCAQVIVLSHNPNFLHMLWGRLSPARRKTIQFGRIGEYNTTISEWDIEEAVKARYHADLETLQRYYSDVEGNPRDVVQKIRPVLEGFFRSLYPSQFGDKDWLGDIIAKIRAAGDDHPHFKQLDDIDDLNAYTARYHHSENNPKAATEPIDDTELKTSVKLALTKVGGF